MGLDDDIQFTKKHALVMIPLAQNPQPNFKKFFLNLNYTTPLVITGFEQLSSSICCRVMAGQSLP